MLMIPYYDNTFTEVITEVLLSFLKPRVELCLTYFSRSVFLLETIHSLASSSDSYINVDMTESQLI